MSIYEYDEEKELALFRAAEREEGREEGLKMKALETAKNLKTKGIDFSIIAECTGLSIETVGAL